MEAIISSRSPLADLPRSVIHNITASLVLSWCLVSSRIMLFLDGIFFFSNNLDLPRTHKSNLLKWDNISHLHFLSNCHSFLFFFFFLTQTLRGFVTSENFEAKTHRIIAHKPFYLFFGQKR